MAKNRKDSTVAAVICAALGNIFWGFSFLFIKVALSFAPNSNVMLAHRFVLATLFMVLYLLICRKKISFRGKNWRPIFLLLLMMVLYYVFETYGILLTNSTVAGLVLAVVPVVTLATGALFLREYPTRRQVLFCAMPVAGVIIITASGMERGVISGLGILFLLLTMLASALYKTANRSAARDFTSFERTLLVLGISAVTFTILGLQSVDWHISAFLQPLSNGKYILCVLSLSLLCSIAANLLVNYASGKMSVFKVASFGSLSTLCSTVVGVVFLKEDASIALLVGAAMILIGIRQVTKPQPQT